jgi:hypothetical protein
MENQFKEKLKAYIENSKLSPEEKELWGLFMLKSDELEDEAVFEAVSEKEENLALLTKHLLDKILSMDREWGDVSEDEAAYSKTI